jgi:hypothetical protein
LQQALLFRVIQTGGQGQAKRSSTYNVPQNAEQANGAKDALARELYSRMVGNKDGGKKELHYVTLPHSHRILIDSSIGLLPK